MKLLIIGSKGFVGMHVLSYFRKKGDNAFGCDVMVDYNDPNYFQVGATNASYEEIFLNHRYEVCVNCSGAASVTDSFAHPLRDFHLNVHNVYIILDLIRKHNPSCKFINLSSAAVYGNSKLLPVKETAPAIPVSPYGWHKLYAEQICNEFHAFFGLPVCSLRVFSAYGPGLYKQLFWDWSQKLKHSSHILLFGTGKESRDFIFIDDIVQALHCAIRNSSFNAEIINVANGREIYIADAIEVFKAESEINFTYDFINEVRTGDPVNWVADIGKLSKLGYKQSVSFIDGIKHYIQWLKEKR